MNPDDILKAIESMLKEESEYEDHCINSYPELQLQYYPKRDIKALRTFKEVIERSRKALPRAAEPAE